MQCVNQNTELSSHEAIRCQFNGGRCAIKSGIDVHQDFYVVVMQEGGATRSRRSVLRKKRSSIGRPDSKRKAAQKCTQFMKRVGLVFLCSGN
jgi:hypothetical protein